MAINTRSRSFRIVFAVVAVLVIFTLATQFRDRPSAVPPAPLEVGEEAFEASPAPVDVSEDIPAEQTEEMDSMPPAKRIVHVPDAASSEPAESETWEDKPFKMTMDRALEFALNGDTEKAVFFADIANQCEHYIKHKSAVLSELEANANTYGVVSYGLDDGFGHSRSIRSAAEYESIVMQRLNRCEEAKGFFSQELRKKLQTEAERGNVGARYLYAMWRPAFSDKPVESFFERLEYEQHALAFTWQNILEKEPLGLLGMGQSYGAREFFTPTEYHMSIGFLLAAYKCGAQSEWLENKIRRMSEMTAELAWDVSEKVVSRYCDVE